MIWLYWLLSYGVGNFMTAYFVGKVYKVNLQEERSKNLGARNAGSVIGKAAFTWTLLGDLVKGVFIVVLGRLLHLEEWVIVGGACFVILGHLYPIWLKFNGGKGVATFIGVGLVLSPELFLMMILGTTLTAIVTRSLTLGMLGGFVFYVSAIIISGQLQTYILLIFAIVLMLIKHRSNVQESLGRKK
ncbi:membrane protein [Lysinibacillus contaminans]|uniref:Glycerol-3-phosphate acyltransferase n=1 Tax=Lysinibacillus contaminans TaxID=1293441 RepID=A0ABR5K2U1_9BACI|nr:glycerol-3-phosphate acyltransferase [Lysinibacillus contaminans]KOS69186.1 membrane protein [Lysinibacillus contaminans]